MKENIDTYTQVILGTAVKDNTLLIYPINYSVNHILDVLIRYFLKKDDSKKVAIILNRTESWNYFRDLHEGFEEYQFKQIISTYSIEKRETL